MNVGIIGLGLIGGSMARSIKARTDHTVWGQDKDGETMTLARLSGAIDGALTEEKLSECELVLLAIRPQAAVAWTRENARFFGAGTTLVDLCGVKRAVCGELAALARENGFSYIGGHPMAGREFGGFVNSRDDLFVGASMILTPDEHTDMEMLTVLKDFFTDVGFAQLTFSTPEEHDRIIAYTSQLAHIVSSAYVKSPQALERRGFSAGSFRDMTRVARLDPDMWTELCLSDADYLTNELEILVNNLNEYLAALRSRDAEELKRLFKEGREMKAKAGGN